MCGGQAITSRSSAVLALAEPPSFSEGANYFYGVLERCLKGILVSLFYSSNLTQHGQRLLGRSHRDLCYVVAVHTLHWMARQP